MSAIGAELPLARLGRSVRRALQQLGSMAWLASACVRQAARLSRAQLAVVVESARNQVRFTALDALFLVTFAALLLGAATLLQVYNQLQGFVSDAGVIKLVVILLVRELGPVLVAVVVVGRSGTAIASEMASLKLGREADTLYATGVDPLGYLLVPRILGGVVSLFTLLVIFDAVALLGGFLLASSSIPFATGFYLTRVQRSIGAPELVGTLLKSIAIGFAIPLVCAHAGLRVKVSATEIPQAVTRAAVESILAVFLLDAAISLSFHA